MTERARKRRPDDPWWVGMWLWLVRYKGVLSWLGGMGVGTFMTMIVARFFLLDRLVLHEVHMATSDTRITASEKVEVDLKASVNVLLKSACLDRTSDEQDMIGLIGCPPSLHKEKKP